MIRQAANYVKYGKLQRIFYRNKLLEFCKDSKKVILMSDNDTYLMTLFTEQSTQEDFYNYLTNKYEWAKTYIYYYIFQVYAIRKSIIPILESISENDRKSFSPEVAYKYLKQYEKQRLNIAIIIPTYNRHKTIKYSLSVCAPLYRRYGIDIIIYDSSINNETREVVEEFRKDGYLNVIYESYKGKFDGVSLDHKVINAYKQFGSEYEYMWQCRDGLIPIIDDIIDELRIFSKKGIDCIIVDTKSRNGNVEKRRFYSTFEDCERLLNDQASRLQTLGMLIISNRLFEKMIRSEPLSKKTYSLWQMSAPFHLFAKEPYTIAFIVKNVFAMNIMASTGHFWGKAQTTLEQWAKNWDNVIMNMPKEYDNVKNECLMIYTSDFHPFQARSILAMRGWGGVNIQHGKGI